MAHNIDAATLETVARSVGYRTADRYRKRCNFLFENIDLHDARMLDVGSGKGAIAIWAGLHGAARVLGIEPESDGSTSGTFDRFRKTISDLALGSVVEARGSFLDDLTPTDGPFDVAVLFQVVNHLDEQAVVDLHYSATAVSKYVTALRHLRALMTEGGIVIVSDCDRRNFWNDIGLRNPLMPTIEWAKHQPPSIWTEVFKQAGFALHDLRWSPIYPIGRVSSNWPLHYMTISHFTMRFRAV